MCIVQIVYDAFNVPTIIQAVTFISIIKAIWISITGVQKCVFIGHEIWCSFAINMWYYPNKYMLMYFISLMLTLFTFIATVFFEHFFNWYWTRGPRGPWVAHLRKRSKVTMGPIIENPQGHNLNNFGRGPFDDVIY